MTLAPGTRLGPYEILTPIGAGGMGEVYRARDAKLDRDVAVKVLPALLTSNPDALARFEREAKAVAALSHPNILAIFDFGTHGGVSYAVTELLEGETLRGKLDGSTVTQKQAVDWALQIAKGLSAAHGKGVVHRDLKPDNVFVTNDGHVKILDFGLAKRVDPAPDQQTNAPTGTGGGHTEPGTVMGTMGYMSPEQVRGLPVDHRTDLFSFGAILYELLSGKKAFKRDTASDTIAAILKEEPPELTQSGRNISPALDHIIHHCLEKDRENRFQSAKDVAFALSEASSPTTGVPSGSYVVPPSPRRGPGKAIWFIAAFTAVFAAAAFLFWRPSKPGASSSKGGPTRIAVLPFENLGAPEDDYFADGMADEIRGKLTSLPGVQVIARGSSTPYKKTNKTPRQIAQELNASYLLTATVRWEKSAGASRVHVSPELVDVTRPDAPTSRWQQPFDAAMTDVFKVQSDIATKVAQALGGALGAQEQKQLAEKPTQNLAAYDAFLKGEEIRNSGAGDPPSLRKEIGFYDQAVALDPGFAQAWAGLSSANSLLYSNGTPVPGLAERARQAGEKAVSLAPSSPEGYLALATYERVVPRDYTRALQQSEKALRLAPGDASALRQTALAEEGLGRWDAALEHLRQAQRLDPRSASILRILGDNFLSLRRYPEAREAFDRGLALAPSNLILIEWKVLTYLGEGDLAGARAVLKAAPREVEPTALVATLANYQDLVWVLDAEQRELLLRLTPSAFDDDRGVWAYCFAQAYALRGDTANDRIYAEEARKAFEEQLRAAPDDPVRRVELGIALAYLGRKEEAVREGERGVALDPISKDAATGPYIQHQLVRVYMLVGEPEKALDKLEPLLKIPYYLSPAWLKIDPNFDPLRENPRFKKLVGG
jgi:eukaryotic-like serine/threonine-protein kinase